MAKPQKYSAARNMRRLGKSIKEIARHLEVSRSSVSLWSRDIQLTPVQLANLHSRMVAGGYYGRLKGAQMQRERREAKVRRYQMMGVKHLGPMKKRDLLLVGLGLYLGEGNKSGNKFQFTNSNPRLIKLMLTWLQTIFGVGKDRLILNVMINQIHRFRERTVRRYWARVTGVQIKQFNKTVLLYIKNKKVYENVTEHFGTLVVRVRKSSDLQYQILGLCYGVLSRVDSKAG